jgi:YHS domain-containing protein
MSTHEHAPSSSQPNSAVTDPVCGMTVDPVTALSVENDGRQVHFCSERCRDRFVADPAKFTPGDVGAESHQARETPGVQSTASEWTCPMHPEIRRPGPGPCPICGMALEPVDVAAEAGPSHELTDMTRRFWAGVALTIPIVILEMGRHFIPWLHDLIPGPAAIWAQLVLATPVVLWAGWPFFVRGWPPLRPSTSTCSP